MNKKLVAFVVVLALLIVFAIAAVKIIPTGHTGIKITFGQIDDETLQSGLHFKIPFAQRIKVINNKQTDIEIEDEIWGETLEMTTVYAKNVIVTYRIPSDKSAYIYTNVNNVKDLISYDLVASAVKSAMKELDVKTVTNRAKIEELACEKLREQVGIKYGFGTIDVIKVTIYQMDFEESYNNAIAEKQIAQQNYEKQMIENQTIVEKAQAEADALLIRSRAEAESNTIINESLNGAMLEYIKINKWDGSLPKVTNGNSIISID